MVALGIGATIAYQAKLFRVSDGPLLATFHGMQEYASIGTLTFSPDGSRLTIGGTDGTIRTWCLPRN